MESDLRALLGRGNEKVHPSSRWGDCCPWSLLCLGQLWSFVMSISLSFCSFLLSELSNRSDRLSNESLSIASPEEEDKRGGLSVAKIYVFRTDSLEAGAQFAPRSGHLSRSGKAKPSTRLRKCHPSLAQVFAFGFSVFHSLEVALYLR